MRNGGEHEWAKIRPSTREADLFDRYISDEDCQLLLQFPQTAGGAVHTPPQVAASLSTFALAALHGALLATVADTKERQGTVVGLQLVRELMELLINKGSKGGGKAVPYAASVLAQMTFLDLPVLPLPPPPPPPVIDSDEDVDGAKKKKKKKKKPTKEEEQEMEKAAKKAAKRAADAAKKRAETFVVEDYQPLTMRRALLKQTDLLLPFLTALLDPSQPLASLVRQSGLALLSSLVQPEEGLGARFWRERMAEKMSTEYTKAQEAEERLQKEQAVEKDRQNQKKAQELKKLEMQMGTAAFQEMRKKQKHSGEEGPEGDEEEEKAEKQRRWRQWGRLWEQRWACLEQSLRQQQQGRIDELCAYGVHADLLKLCTANGDGPKMPWAVQRRAMAVVMVITSHMPAVRANFTPKHVVMLVELLPTVDVRVLPYVCVSVWAIARLPRLRVVLGREKCIHALLHWVSLIHSAYVGRGVASLLGIDVKKGNGPRRGVRFSVEEEQTEKAMREIEAAAAKAAAEQKEKEEDEEKEKAAAARKANKMSGGDDEEDENEEKEKKPVPRRMSVVEREKAAQAVANEKLRRSDALHLSQLIKIYMRRDPDDWSSAEDSGGGEGRRRLLELLRWVLGAVWMLSVDSASRMAMATDSITEVGSSRSNVSKLLLNTIAQLLHQHVVMAGRAAGHRSNAQLTIHNSLDIVDIQVEGGYKAGPGAFRLCEEGWGCVFFALQSLRTLCTPGAAAAAGEKFSAAAPSKKAASSEGRRPSMTSVALASAMSDAQVSVGGQSAVDIPAERLAVQAVTGHGLLSLLGQLAVLDINDNITSTHSADPLPRSSTPPALTIAAAQFREVLMRQGAKRHAEKKKVAETEAKKKREQEQEMAAVHKAADLEAKKLEEEEEKELERQGKGRRKTKERQPLYTSPHELAKQKLQQKQRAKASDDAPNAETSAAQSPVKAAKDEGKPEGKNGNSKDDADAAKKAAEAGKHRNARHRNEVKARFRRFSKLVVTDVRVQALTPEQRRHAGLMDIMLRKQHEVEGEGSIEKQMLLMLCHRDPSCAACAAECLAELARTSRRKRRSIADLGGITVLLAIAAQAEESWVRWADLEATRSWRRKHWLSQRRQRRQWEQEQHGQLDTAASEALDRLDELDFELEDQAKERALQQEQLGQRQPTRAQQADEAKGKSIVLCAVLQTLAELAKSTDLQVDICKDGLDLLLRCSKLGASNWETTVGAMTTLRLLSTNKHNRTQLYKAELRASATAIVQQSATREHEQAPQGQGAAEVAGNAGYVQVPSPAASLSVPILNLGAQKDPLLESVPSLSVQEDMACQHEKQRRREQQHQQLRRRLALLQDLDGGDSDAAPDAALSSLQAMAAGDGGAKGDWGEYVDGHFTSIATPRSRTLHYIKQAQTAMGEATAQVSTSAKHKKGVRAIDDKGLYSTLLAAPPPERGLISRSADAPTNLQEFFSLPAIGAIGTKQAASKSLSALPQLQTTLAPVSSEEEETSEEQKSTYPLTASMPGFDCTDLTKQDFDSIVDELRRTRSLWTDKKISTISREQLLPSRQTTKEDNDLAVRNLPRVRVPALRPNQVASLQKRLNGELRRQARFLWEEAYSNERLLEKQRKGRDVGSTFDGAYRMQSQFGDGLIGILGGELAAGEIQLLSPVGNTGPSPFGNSAASGGVRLMPANSHLNLEANIKFKSEVDQTKQMRLPTLYGQGGPRSPRVPADDDHAPCVQYRNDLYTHVRLKDGRVACVPTDHTSRPPASTLQAKHTNTSASSPEAPSLPPGLDDLPHSLTMPDAVRLPVLQVPMRLFGCVPTAEWEFEGVGTKEEIRRKAAAYRRFDFSSIDGLIVEEVEEADGEEGEDEEGAEGRTSPTLSAAAGAGAAGDGDGDPEDAAADEMPAEPKPKGALDLAAVIERGVMRGRDSSGWGECAECSTKTTPAMVMRTPALPPPLLPWDLSPLPSTPIKPAAPLWSKPSTTPAGWTFAEHAGVAAAKEEDDRFVRVEHLVSMPGILPDKLLTFRVIGYAAEGELQVPPPIVKFTPALWTVDDNTPKMPNYTNWPPYRGGKLALFSDAGGRIEYQLLHNGQRLLSDVEQANKVASMFEESMFGEQGKKNRKSRAKTRKTSVVTKSKTKRKTQAVRKTVAKAASSSSLNDVTAKAKKSRKTFAAGNRRMSLKALGGDILGAISELKNEGGEWTVYEKPIDLMHTGTFNIKARVIKQFNSQPEPVMSKTCEPTIVKVTKEPWSLYTSVWMTRQFESETREFTGSRTVVRRMFHQDLENCWSKKSFREYMVDAMGLANPHMTFAEVNKMPDFQELRGHLFEGYDGMLSLFAYYSALSGHPQLQVTLETFKKMVDELNIPDNFGASKDVLSIMFRASNVIQRTEEQAMKLAAMGGGMGVQRKGSVLEAAGMPKKLERKGSVMNDDVALMRFEFVELVIRLAVVKYLDQGKQGKHKIEGASTYPPDAVNMLCRNHMLPSLVEPRWEKGSVSACDSVAYACRKTYLMPHMLLSNFLKPTFRLTDLSTNGPFDERTFRLTDLSTNRLTD
jgi:hypothetical protein